VIDNILGSSIGKAEELSKKYITLVEEIRIRFGLIDISAGTSVNKFLYSPVNELRKGLFYPLFDLLRSNTDAEIFYQQATDETLRSFNHLYTSGYKKWASLSIMKAFNPNQLLGIHMSELDMYTFHKSGGNVERVPNPTTIDRIHFHDFNESAALTVPDFILYSSNHNIYLSISPDVTQPMTFISGSYPDREWLPASTYGLLSPRHTMIYIDENPNNLSLISDLYKTCRPDLLLDFHTEEKPSLEDCLDNIKSCHNQVKPTIGTFIITDTIQNEHFCNNLGDGINLLPVGLDESKLAPLIDSIIKSK
ncbi:MAG: hypothetical protein GX102_16200, partial [Porphyromonadaceae bacterium]|nr:hypothetical protein [Porphyromonadaceae bacterium]